MLNINISRIEKWKEEKKTNNTESISLESKLSSKVQMPYENIIATCQYWNKLGKNA